MQKWSYMGLNIGANGTVTGGQYQGARRWERTCFLSLLVLILLCKAQSQTDTAKVTGVTPNSIVPGRSLKVEVKGANLSGIKRLVLQTPGKLLVSDSLTECIDDKTARCGVLNIPPDVVPKEYPILTATDEQGATTSPTNLKFVVLSSLPSEIGYVSCPTFIGPKSPAGSSAVQTPDEGLDQITCSQSLLSRNEAADIFGKRVANTYLVVQVDVRNLSDAYQFLLHDVRLVYDETAIAGREKRLVRGVSEKGQAYDVRNLVVRSVEGTGSILGGLSVFKFATVDFKNAVNVYQGPFASALKSIFPDFTIGQLNRLNDLGFGTQSIVVPKKSSIALVTFLPQQVFLDKNDRKMLKTAWWDPRQPTQSMLDFQKRIGVEVAGAHVEEIQSTEPTLKIMNPLEAARNDSITPTIIGTNLDRVAAVRIGEATDTTNAPILINLTLPQHDPTFAIGKATQVTLSEGSYSIYLETNLGKVIPTSLKFTVKSPIKSPEDVPQIDSLSPDAVKPKVGAAPVKTDITISGSHLEKITDIAKASETGCSDQEIPGVTLQIKDKATSTGKTMVVTATVTSDAKTRTKEPKAKWCFKLDNGKNISIDVPLAITEK
jgi:hypothetical protein